MPPKAGQGELTRKFLQELSRTLDIKATLDALNMSEEAARSIFLNLAGAKPAQPKLFEEAPCGAYEIRVDGASRGNPGQAGAGAVIRDPNGNIVRELRKYLGVITNNAAEYSALIMALTEARAMGVSTVEVFADSELMVRQVKGEYKVKSADLKPLYDSVMSLLKGFKGYKIVHVYREENSLADKLANEAIDGRG